MIAVTFSIQNPYFRSWRDFKNIRNWHGHLPWKNKYWEFEVLQSGALVEFDFTVRTRCDHSGATLGLGLFGYSINATLYDNRHWDVENNCWKVYGQSN
jgi:hypothetical protein